MGFTYYEWWERFPAPGCLCYLLSDITALTNACSLPSLTAVERKTMLMIFTFAS
jgi:hypothetical protein